MGREERHCMRARSWRYQRSMSTAGTVPSRIRLTLVVLRRRRLKTAVCAARPRKGRRKVEAPAAVATVSGIAAVSSEPRSSGMCDALKTARQRRMGRVRVSYGRRSWRRTTVAADRCWSTARPPKWGRSPTGVVVVAARRTGDRRPVGERTFPATDQLCHQGDQQGGARDGVGRPSRSVIAASSMCCCGRFLTVRI